MSTETKELHTHIQNWQHHLQQCITLDPKLGTTSVANLLNNISSPNRVLKQINRTILSMDNAQLFHEAPHHPSLRDASGLKFGTP